MAIIKCYECGKDISDKAKACPHCGAPYTLGENENQLETKTNDGGLKKGDTDVSNMSRAFGVIFVIVLLAMFWILASPGTDAFMRHFGM